MNALEATIALSKYVEDHFSTLPVFVDPTTEIAASDASLANGWVELHFNFGEKGPNGGRFGPSSTYYNSLAAMSCSILTPREIGDGVARAASVELEELLLEATIGDVLVIGSRESVAPLEDDDTHLQIDRIFTLEVESFLNIADRPFEAPPVTERISERITLSAPHGLVVGNVVYRTPTGLTKAIAATDASLAIGMVSAVHTDLTLDVTFRGIIYWTHGLGAAGTKAYLSTSSAGAVQTSEPGPGSWRQYLGQAWNSSDQFLFAPEPGELL